MFGASSVKKNSPKNWMASGVGIGAKVGFEPTFICYGHIELPTLYKAK